MASSDLHAVTVRLDVLQNIMLELAAALPSDRAAGVVTVIGNRLTERLRDMEIDETTDDAMVSDLAPILAALGQDFVTIESTPVVRERRDWHRLFVEIIRSSPSFRVGSAAANPHSDSV